MSCFAYSTEYFGLAVEVHLKKKKILLNQMQTSVVASECSVSCASRDLV